VISSRNRLRGGGDDSSWPGFVDALSTLLLAIIFLLSLFVLSQFFLNQALSGREQALADLRVQVTQLGNLLELEKEANAKLRLSLEDLSANLNAANSDRDDLAVKLAGTTETLTAAKARLEELESRAESQAREVSRLTTDLGTQGTALAEAQQLSTRAQAEVAQLRSNVSALEAQIKRLSDALEASEARDRQSQAVIVDLGRRLNRALASKVAELASYRSEFFGRLREVLSQRPEIRIEGDRFVFQSELLFESGSAELGGAGRAELRTFAETLLEISTDIPPELNWILRVDGHTDKRPIFNSQFRSNWQLSSARAIAVVEFLIAAGVAPERLAATGFGEFQPLDDRETPAALARNRRIEMRLTQR